MTRVNLIPVENLSDQHLFSEWREIKRIPTFLKKLLKTKSEKEILSRIPLSFTLNKGHVLFFLDKMLFLHNRYVKLTEELVNRNYKITEFDADDMFLTVPISFRQKEWIPSSVEIDISLERILNKIKEKDNWYRYYGKAMNTEYFVTLSSLDIEYS